MSSLVTNSSKYVVCVYATFSIECIYTFIHVYITYYSYRGSSDECSNFRPINSSLQLGIVEKDRNVELIFSNFKGFRKRSRIAFRFMEFFELWKVYCVNRFVFTCYTTERLDFR